MARLNQNSTINLTSEGDLNHSSHMAHESSTGHDHMVWKFNFYQMDFSE